MRVRLLVSLCDDIAFGVTLHGFLSDVNGGRSDTEEHERTPVRDMYVEYIKDGIHREACASLIYTSNYRELREDRYFKNRGEIPILSLENVRISEYLT